MRSTPWPLHGRSVPGVVLAALMVGALLLVPRVASAGPAAAAPPPLGWSAAPSLPGTYTPRWDFAYGYFPPSDQVVVFGGAPAQLGQSWMNDTWLYANGAWTKGPNAPAGLTARGGAAMAYDPVSGKMVLFGGGAGNEWPPRNDTWLWDGTRWSAGPSAPAGLAGRTGAQMVFDPDINKIVLFGGSGLLPYTDVWFYNGATNSWSAGPSTPQAVAPRVFFGMTYDPLLHKIIVMGGDGLSDSWYFDGSNWSPGPVLPDSVANNLRERTTLAYDPQLGAEVLWTGLGSGYPTKSVFYLRGSDWSWIMEDPDQAMYTPPTARVEGGMVWVPSQDTMMMFGGVDPANNGTNALADAWFFRDIAPQTSSVTLDNYAPVQASAITASIQPPNGGYYSTTRTVQWLRNDAVIAGVTGTVLNPGLFLPGDRIVAQAQYVDDLGVSGPWVSSPVATVAMPTLTVVDGTPGTGLATTGTGFGNMESIDFRIDSPTSKVLKTITSGVTGSWGVGQSLPLPKAIVGGQHTAYATGRTTGSIASAPFRVLPAATLNPTKFTAGAATTLSGAGFLSGELVTLTFPGSAPVTVGADAQGSITKSLTSPAEPYPGDNVTASAASGTALAPYTTKAVMTVTGTIKPGAIPVSLTGYGRTEPVTLTMEGSSQALSTDAVGSLNASSTLVSTWGTHSLAVTGSTSGITLSKNVTFTAAMTATPASGPVGTVVTIDSGPGWAPGTTVQLSWGSAVRQTLRADSQGAVHTTYSIPTHSIGVTYLKLSDTVLHATVKAAFTITQGQAVLTVADGSPSTAVATTGAGFKANEVVDLHLDSMSGSILKTVTASVSGSWGTGQTMPLPAIVVGGTHTIYAVGNLGSTATATFRVLPGGAISPVKFPAGAVTTFTGAGFASGESVSVSLPGGAPTVATADANGSFSAAITSPAEPYPGDVATASAPSGTATAAYSVANAVTVIGTPVPGNIVLSITGYGAAEAVTFTMDGQTQTGTTDSFGSLTATLTFNTSYGPHDITVTGSASGQTKTITVTLQSPAAITVSNGVPGQAVTTTGSGWGSAELVDMHLDSVTGPILKTITTWTNGTWGSGQSVPLPPPLAGGPHTMWAVGRTTGYVAAATFTVTPTISMSPTKVAAGDTTTVSGMGFVPGETVAVTFPGGSAVMVVADAVGNVTAAVVSPPEPFPGGVLTATAPSATVTTSYTVQPVIDEVGPQGPMNMPLSLTGWAALETVTFSMDGQSQTYVTDMNGSLDVTVTLPSTWGTHVLSVVGSTSGISMTDQMTFTASMTINPSSGPVGTAVAIDSGPGWVPGSQLTLTWAPPNQQILTADSTGAIHTTFVIPTHDRGVVYFKLSDTVLGVTVKLPFTVT